MTEYTRAHLVGKVPTAAEPLKVDERKNSRPTQTT